MGKYLQDDLEDIARHDKMRSVGLIYRMHKTSRAKVWLWSSLLLLLVILFLPWTQNIRARGNVTTVRQEQRPQELNAIIAGTIVKWYVREGDFVQKGDTILQLGEVKVDYMDPQLLKKTEEQILSKKISAEGYKNKADAAGTQMKALDEGRKLKLQSLDNKIGQQQLKLNSDEMEQAAALNEFNAMTRQITAAKQMLDSGAISLVDYERRKISYQNAVAKYKIAANKLNQSKQELLNLKIEQQAVEQDYLDKIAKAAGDKYSSISNAASTDAEVSKLQNLYANYDVRNKMYYVIAPQSGQINKAKKAGLGEFVKEGDMIVQIVPNDMQYAVELFVQPMDLPLVNVGQEVCFVFDGFPAIVFSGWPSNSYGTFRGKVLAVEKSVSSNSKFRVLITEDPKDRKWPAQLSIGTGAQGIMLLKDVRIYYELWRNINGFPPQFYSTESDKEKEKK